MSCELLERLRWKASFGPEDNDYEAAADEIETLRRENAAMYERLRAARKGTELLDRMQETRVLVLPDGRGIISGGRQDGWLCWRHPDGQWVTAEKCRIERIDSFLAPAQEGE